MPRNAAGVYTLPAGNPVITGTTIQSTWANTTMPDLGNEVTNSLDRSGRGSMLAPLKLVDGSQAAPGLTFSAEPSSGWFRAAAGQLGLSVLNTLVATATPTGLSWALALGLVGAPSLFFSGDTNTGIYSPGADIFAVTVAGAEVSRWSAAQQSNVLGAVGTPSYSFTGDLNTGMWSPGADILALSTAAIERYRVNATGQHLFGGTTPGVSGASHFTIASYGGATTLGSLIAAGGAEYLFGAGALESFSGSFTNHIYSLRTNNVNRVSISAAGVVTINTPGAGAHVINGLDATMLLVAGTNRQMRFRVVTGDTWMEAVDNPITVHTPLNIGGSIVNLTASGVVKWTMNNNGTITASNQLADEQIRFARDSAFLSFYNTAGATRTGYIQMTATSGAQYASEHANGFHSFETAGSQRFLIDNVGRLRANNIHNNASGITGTTPYIGSGTWTPTIVGGANCNGTPTPSVGNWIRCGNVVSCVVVVSVNSVGAGATAYTISLPIASNFTAGTELWGTNQIRTNLAGAYGLGCTAQAAADTCQVNINVTAARIDDWISCFQYIVQ